jgi:hypothetical protein
VARRPPSARAAYAVERRPYENSCARFMKLHEGKVIDGTAFHDSIPFRPLDPSRTPELTRSARLQGHSLLRRSA